MIEAPLHFVKPPTSAEATAGKREPKPEWLKVRAPGSENYLRLRGIMRDLKLNTVCEDAHCPNIGECWHHGTATFMILGDVCTRNCAYCAVAHGTPAPLDPVEPVRLAEAVTDAVTPLRPASFRITAKRGNKRFPLTSNQINVQLGSLVNSLTGARVDLERPQLTIYEIGRAHV